MLTFMEFSGSPYQTGLALGRFGAPAVHSILIHSPAWQQAMRWRGSEQILAMQALVQEHHPYIWDELQGLARGLELPPDDVFIWNCRNDLPPPSRDTGLYWSATDAEHAAPANADHGQPSPDDPKIPLPGTGESVPASVDSLQKAGESLQDTDELVPDTDESLTVLTATASGPRIVHSLNGHPELLEHCGIAEFTIDLGYEFAAFILPGSLPGTTFGVTGKGLAVTVNLVPAAESAPGIPTAVLARALLGMNDLSAAVQLLNASPRAGTAHVGISQLGGATILGIEFDPGDVSVQAVKPAAVHTNHLVHDTMQEHDRLVHESSRQRFNDANAMLHMADDADPMQILTDRSNPVFPLYRAGVSQPAGPDAQSTLAIADMSIGTDDVSWDVYTVPGEAARFRMRNARHI